MGRHRHCGHAETAGDLADRSGCRATVDHFGAGGHSTLAEPDDGPFQLSGADTGLVGRHVVGDMSNREHLTAEGGRPGQDDGKNVLGRFRPVKARHKRP